MSQFLNGLTIGALIGATSIYILSKLKNASADGSDLALFEVLQGIKKTKKNTLNNDAELEILQEQLVRNFQYFGEEGQERVMGSYVVVVGLGGVGSHAAISLARSGVSKLRIIDFDRVTVSSLNRHACATRNDVGRSKSEVLTQYIASFSPATQVEALETFYEPSKADMILGDHPVWGKPDFVIDAIDNIATKIDLIVQCTERNLQVIVACGAGGKSDPTALRIDDISLTKEDQLARAVRKQLSLKGIYKGIPMVYSLERNSKSLMPLQDHQEDNPDEFTALKGLRVRTVPVIGPIPAIMGQSIAAFVLCKLAGEESILGMRPDDVEKMKREKKMKEEQEMKNNGIVRSFAINKKNYVKLWTATKTEFIEDENESINQVGKHLYQLVNDEDGFRVSVLIWDLCKGVCVISGRAGPPNLIRAVPFPIERQEDGTWITFPVLMMSTPARAHLIAFKELLARSNGRFDEIGDLLTTTTIKWPGDVETLTNVYEVAKAIHKKWKVI